MLVAPSEDPYEAEMTIKGVGNPIAIVRVKEVSTSAREAGYKPGDIVYTTPGSIVELNLEQGRRYGCITFDQVIGVLRGAVAREVKITGAEIRAKNEAAKAQAALADVPEAMSTIARVTPGAKVLVN